MKTYPCPSCGANVVFRTSVAAYAVCPYCRAMLVRVDDGIKSMGEAAQVPEDTSPFQIGTGGIYNGVHFGIVGRIKMGWKDGSWNEWFIVSDDARKGWLAEAQGFYAPCFDVTDVLDDDTRRALARLANDMNVGKQQATPTDMLGKYFSLNGKKYHIVDIKDAECIGAEGELPMGATKGRDSLSIDLLYGEGEFASIEFTKDSTRVYTGRYVEWQELSCTYFRTFDGW
ncbi:MAG: DUF4178 domain-containing protein [Micavibrio sp.]|nr:DUF4178 domain-containing protein [Micavibrio sp.]